MIRPFLVALVILAVTTPAHATRDTPYGRIEAIAAGLETITDPVSSIEARRAASRELAEIYRQEALALSSRGDIDRAWNLLRAARALGYSGRDDEFIAELSMPVQSAIESFQNLIHSDPDAATRSLDRVPLPRAAFVRSMRAHSLAAAGRFDTAEVELRLAWAVSPGSNQALAALDAYLVTRARVMRADGKAPAAIAFLKSADTSLPAASILRAELMMAEGDTASGLAELRKTALEAGVPAAFHAALAGALARAGELDEIDKRYGGAGLLPRSANRLLNIARQRIEENDRATALHVERHARRLFPESEEQWSSLHSADRLPAPAGHDTIARLAADIAEYRAQRKFDAFHGALVKFIRERGSPGASDVRYAFEVLRAKGRMGEAIRLIDAAIKVSPTIWKELAGELAVIQVEKGAWRSALVMMEHALETDSSPASIALAARLSVRAGMTENASRLYSRALDLAENREDKAALAAEFMRILANDDRFLEASSLADSFIEESGSAPEYVLFLKAYALYGQGRGKEILFRESWLDDRSFAVEDRLKLAVTSGRYENAVKICRESSSPGAFSGDAALTCLDLAVRGGEMNRAKSIARDLTRRYPGTVLEAGGNARLFLALRDYEGAMASAWKGLRIAPSHTGIRLLLAESLWSIGRPGAAMNILEPILAALPRGPELARALASYGTAALSAGLVDPGKAAFDEALAIAEEYRLKPLADDIRFNLAIAERHSGNPGAAYGHIQAVKDDAYDARLLKASILFDMDLRDEALRLLSSETLQSPVAQLNYAIMLRRSLHFDEAAEVLGRLLNHWPQQGIILYHLGKVQAGKGDFESARSTLESAVEIEADPNLSALYQKELNLIPSTER